MHLAYPAASLQALQSNNYKQIIQIQRNTKGLKTSTVRRQSVGYLQASVVKDLNLGPPRANPVTRQSGIDSNLGLPDRESDALTTQPRCLL